MRKSISTIVKNFKIRIDKEGSGKFGAKRKHGKHQGIDILTTKGEKILAPFPMKLVRIAKPYATGTMSGALYRTKEGMEMKIFYMKPFTDTRDIQEGQIIGIAQSVSDHWKSPKMKDHIHLEIRDKYGDLQDPTQYI